MAHCIVICLPSCHEYGWPDLERCDKQKRLEAVQAAMVKRVELDA